MAKASKQDRRARAAAALAEQRRKERRTTIVIGAVTALVVIGVLALGVVPYVRDLQQQKQVDQTPLSSLGVSADQAGCTDEQTTKATGSGDHVPDGTKVPYATTPPSFGSHYATWAPFEKKFYTTGDRPAVGNLVHNLEHGYTIAWYAEDAPASDVDALKKIAGKFDGTARTNMFIAAPWTSDDGKAMPDGRTIALAHWSADAQQQGQEGVLQYCGKASGEVIADFMKRHPWSKAPEPGVV